MSSRSLNRTFLRAKSELTQSAERFISKKILRSSGLELKLQLIGGKGV